jgi:hypothetical protein
MGIIVERLRVPEHDAFAILRMISRHAHKKLRDVAEKVIVTGKLSGLREMNVHRTDLGAPPVARRRVLSKDGS